MIDDKNYFVVSGWMVNRLKLSGNDLNVYAIIYGFSQGDGIGFIGSAQYLADFCGMSRRSLMDVLNRLVKANLIQKKSEIVDGVKHCMYKTVPVEGYEVSSQDMRNPHMGYEESSQGDMRKSHRGYEESSHNKELYSLSDKEQYKEINTSKAKTENPSGENSIAEEKTSQDVNAEKKSIADDAENTAKVNEVLKLFTALCPSLPSVKKITAERKRHISGRLSQGYTIDDFRQVFTKAEASDFCRGINGRNWKADFDFLISDSGFTKTLEGKYDNKDANGNVSTTAHGVPRKIAYRRYRDVDGSDFDLVVKMDGSTMNITKAYDDGRTESFQCKVGSEPAWIK